MIFFVIDDFVINGSKLWIINGFQVDWICFLANISGGLLYKNKFLICVFFNLFGVYKVRNINKFGMYLLDIVELFFEDVKVLQLYLIGQEGMGFLYQMFQFVEERVFVGVLGIIG